MQQLGHRDGQEAYFGERSDGAAVVGATEQLQAALLRRGGVEEHRQHPLVARSPDRQDVATRQDRIGAELAEGRRAPRAAVSVDLVRIAGELQLA